MPIHILGQPVAITDPLIEPAGQIMELTRIPVVARVTANQLVNNDETQVDVTELFFPVRSGEFWAIILFLLHSSSAVADMDISWDLPGTTPIRWGSTGTPGAVLLAASEARIAGLGATGFEVFHGQLDPDADGNVQLQFGQGTAEVSNTTILARSHLIATRLA